MALEAGAAAHEVFAAHRLYSFKEHGGGAYDLSQRDVDQIVQATGNRLFGVERYNEIASAPDPREDDRSQRIAYSLTALYNCGFYDDPGDKKRTTTNIEEMCIAYIDKFDWREQLPILLEDRTLGIEVPIDVTLTYSIPTVNAEYDTEGRYVEAVPAEPTFLRYRFIGRADGVHWKDRTKSVIRIHENKTASRLGDAWEQSHIMSHQHTGYMIGLSTILGVPIRDTLVLGTALPLPKAYNLGGITRVPVSREAHELRSWFDWFLHTVSIHDEYADRPTNAPHYTHSCNRYFRPCSFIPFCASPPEDREQMLEEMRTEVWSPLDEEGSSD